MKYYEKRKHLLIKVSAGIVIALALFFALCDCSPKTTSQEVTITFQRD